MKRLLAFLVLLAVGIAAMYFAIGDEQAVQANADQKPKEARQRPSVPGVPVQKGRVGTSVAQTGQLRVPRYRTTLRPDGSEMQETIFLLTAADSQPISEGRQQLEGVEVTLYDDAKAAARLVARQAFVTLTRDANGNYSLREDKDIDLRDAVFSTLPGSKLAGLRLELGNALVTVGDSELQIRTANPTDPVLLVVDGQHQGTLRGHGLQARLPRERQGGLHHADIEILHDPVLETEGIVVHARGRLHYVEDTTAGTALVTVEDTVQLELSGGDLVLPGFAAKKTADPAASHPSVSTARGNQFMGWLLRSKQRLADGRDHQESSWRLLQLTGAPATVDMAGGRLLTPRLTILPGLFGDPFLVTAHGGESRVELTENAEGQPLAETIVGTSPRRIHLLRPGADAGATLRSFGFPQWTLRPLNNLQVVAFEGKSRLAGGSRSLDASRGLHIFRPSEVYDERPEPGRDLAPEPAADTGIVQGFGDVRIEQHATQPHAEDLVATGNDGFRLRRTAQSQLLQMGVLPKDLDDPEASWRHHHYDVQRGAAHVHGVGYCEVERRAERTHIWLRAPGAEITGRLASDAAELVGVRQLDALFQDRELQALDVAGLPVRTSLVRDGETVVAAAPRLLRIGERSLRLLPAPSSSSSGQGDGDVGGRGAFADQLWAGLLPEHALPELVQTNRARPGRPAQQLSVRGPQIDVHHLGGDHVLVDAIAIGEQRPRVEARIENPDRAPTTVFGVADRLRLLPYVLTPGVRRWHTGNDGPLADVMFHALGQPWLLVDEVREFRIEDERYGQIDGSGHQLLLSQAAAAALFVGDADRLTPAEVRRSHEGRVTTVRGARVRVVREDEVRLQALRTFADRPTFLLPSLTLHESGHDGLLSHMSAICRGNIEVLPEAVVFDGPVQAQGLLADGSDDPDGIHLEAEQLHMQRQQKLGELLKPGEISRVSGRNVRVDWSRMNATSAQLELDLNSHRCIARDAKDAVVTLPDGRRFIAPRIEVNYETMAIDSSLGRVEQLAKPANHDQ